MPTIQRQAIVSYTPAQMFDLVNDVAQYPAFLPWCASSHIFHQSPTSMKAKVTIAKGPIHHAFITQNTLKQHESIKMTLIDGPFKILNGTWDFKPLEQGSHIHFYLHFEFASPLMSLSFGPIFKHATQTLMDAFIQRAKKVYE